MNIAKNVARNDKKLCWHIFNVKNHRNKKKWVSKTTIINQKASIIGDFTY